MRVQIDPLRCQGHNRCIALAPELFDVDDYGKASMLGDGAVPSNLVDKARLAVANCPEFAISLDETGSDDAAPETLERPNADVV